MTLRTSELLPHTPVHTTAVVQKSNVSYTVETHSDNSIAVIVCRNQKEPIV